MENQDRLRFWQRDLVGILFYVAGAVMAVAAIPMLMTRLFVAGDIMANGGGVDGLNICGVGWKVLVQPVTQILVGTVLLNRSWTIAHFLFPDDTSNS